MTTFDGFYDEPLWAAAARVGCGGDCRDAPGRIRTSDQRLRRPPLFH
jgi:hypothetical protein